jgi:hypothetical protein
VRRSESEGGGFVAIGQELIGQRLDGAAAAMAPWRTACQMASLPLAAPLGPPLTGASSRWACLFAYSARALRTVIGALVVRSKWAVPGRMAKRMLVSL